MAFVCRALGGLGPLALLLLAGVAATPSAGCSDRTPAGTPGQAGGGPVTGGRGPATGGAGGAGASGGAGGTAGMTSAGGAGGEPALNEPSLPGPQVLRRLTDAEYANTVRDLLGEALPTGTQLQPGPDQIDFRLPVGRRIHSESDIAQVVENAELVAARAVTRMSLLLPPSCNTLVPADAGATTDPDSEETCARRFIEQFGVRAYRRPLDQAEQQELLTLYQKIRGSSVGGSFQDGVRVLVTAFLQSPHFLYRWELAGPPMSLGRVPGSTGPVAQRGPFEVASMLSYFLWSSMPDQRLFEAAAAGTLLRPGRIAEEARRMLGDMRARDGLSAFHQAWLGVEHRQLLDKDPSFSSFSPEIARQMMQEPGDFAASVLLGGQADGKLATLLTSSTMVLEPALAAFYGATAAGTGPRPVALDPKQRAGLFTQGAFLATYADSKQDRPFLRGRALTERLLCQDIPEPPDFVLPPLPELMPGQTNRQRYEAVGTETMANCQACHLLFNPPGYALSHYDAVGAFRTMDNGGQVSAGARVMVDRRELIVADAVHLMQELARRPEVQACVARHWVRWLLRRNELRSEEPAIQAAVQLAGADMNVRELLVALTRTRLFTHRTLSPGEPER